LYRGEGARERKPEPERKTYDIIIKTQVVFLYTVDISVAKTRFYEAAFVSVGA